MEKGNHDHLYCTNVPVADKHCMRRDAKKELAPITIFVMSRVETIETIFLFVYLTFLLILLALCKGYRTFPAASCSRINYLNSLLSTSMNDIKDGSINLCNFLLLKVGVVRVFEVLSVDSVVRLVKNGVQ